jgi:release factor glutamine methyltransferase
VTILEIAAARLREAGVDSPRSEARRLLAHALSVTQEDVIAGAVMADPAGLERFEAAVARRCAREPYAYIVSRREFFSRDFEVGPGVLIPRPESEVLVEEALRRFPRVDDTLNVLDLGTGSGCLLLTFLAERPNAEGLGIDKSQAALEVTRRNARRLGLEARTRLLRGNWAEAISGAFDGIFVNPPYIRSGDFVTLAPEVGVHEPASALDGGPDGLDAYRRLAPMISSLLGARGCAFVEIGEGQGEAVQAIFENSNVHVDGTLTDLARIQRCLVMVAAEQQSRAMQK